MLLLQIIPWKHLQSHLNQVTMKSSQTKLEKMTSVYLLHVMIQLKWQVTWKEWYPNMWFHSLNGQQRRFDSLYQLNKNNILKIFRRLHTQMTKLRRKNTQFQLNTMPFYVYYNHLKIFSKTLTFLPRSGSRFGRGWG